MLLIKSVKMIIPENVCDFQFLQREHFPEISQAERRYPFGKCCPEKLLAVQYPDLFQELPSCHFPVDIKHHIFLLFNLVRHRCAAVKGLFK